MAVSGVDPRCGFSGGLIVGVDRYLPAVDVMALDVVLAQHWTSGGCNGVGQAVSAVGYGFDSG